jgi:hypothetical protein
MTNNNKILKPVLYLGWVFAFILLWLNGCESDKIENKTRVTIPEVRGSFEPAKEITHTIIDTVYLDKIIKTNDAKLINDISTLYNENEALKQAYLNETDSLKRELMYLKSIQLNEFYHTFDNDTINITVKGIVQGEVKSFQPFYTIKERQQNVNIPVVKFRLLTGLGVGNSINFDKPLFKANLGFQNTKGNILRASFDTEKRFMLEYDFSLFSIKK